ncbi:MAG: sigma-54 dependent transcriptional regulator [Deltaproteobacteria bacterium]
MKMTDILFIGPASIWEKPIREILKEDWQARHCTLDQEISTHLSKENYQIILLHLSSFKSEDSLKPLRQIKGTTPATPVIILSDVEESNVIVEMVREGAFDFITKPFTKEKISLAINRALETRRLKNEIDYLRREQDIVYDFDTIIADSPAMKKTISTLRKFARTDSTILLTGETGTGKSFLSGAVHFNSHRRKRGFIKINCANIPDTLLESELFGHEKGAFTGANKTRVGRLEQGEGGTVFLDEIGEMSQNLQAKLLRVLEDKSFERVGGNKTIHSDVRIICATNRDPEHQVQQRELREDLYYRINVLRVHLPPLRERPDCIEPLARLMMEKTCRSLKRKINGFSAQALEALQSYNWPGNIRQLANVIERAVILEESSSIQAQHLNLPEPPIVKTENLASPTPPPQTIREQEREIIVRALEDNLWVQKEAARALGITPRALNYKIKKFGISHPRWRKNK